MAAIALRFMATRACHRPLEDTYAASGRHEESVKIEESMVYVYTHVHRTRSKLRRIRHLIAIRRSCKSVKLRKITLSGTGVSSVKNIRTL